MTQFDKVILHGALYFLEKISTCNLNDIDNVYLCSSKLNMYLEEIRFHGYDFYYIQDFDSRSYNVYYVKLLYKNEVKYDAIVKITKSYLERLLTN